MSRVEGCAVLFNYANEIEDNVARRSDKCVFVYNANKNRRRSHHAFRDDRYVAGLGRQGAAADVREGLDRSARYLLIPIDVAHDNGMMAPSVTE
jgi:hypothetical protein